MPQENEGREREGAQAFTGLELVPGDRPGLYRLTGEVDVANAPDLLGALMKRLQEDDAIVLDVSGVSFMDSQGLRVVVELATEAQAQSKSPVVIAAPSEPVRRLLDLVIPGGLPQLVVREDLGPWEGDASPPGARPAGA